MLLGQRCPSAKKEEIVYPDGKTDRKFGFPPTHPTPTPGAFPAFAMAEQRYPRCCVPGVPLGETVRSEGHLENIRCEIPVELE